VIDISSKPDVPRRATAEGFIKLRGPTVRAIAQGSVKKGNPLEAGRIAGLQALKKTHELLPHCHPIPLEHADLSLDLDQEGSGVRAKCEVAARYKTGVEMEALTGVSVALLTVWDMVKYLEKDENGQYPATLITGIRVVQKVKGPAG